MKRQIFTIRDHDLLTQQAYNGAFIKLLSVLICYLFGTHQKWLDRQKDSKSLWWMLKISAVNESKMSKNEESL
jgi:hypothetical protein